MPGMRMVSEQRAERTQRIAPVLDHWWFPDERIGGRQSDSYSLYSRAGVIFVDPLPMSHAAAEDYPAVTYALLTRACHQRAAWRYRFEHGARVTAPRYSPGLKTEPDVSYIEGTRMPEDFRAIHAPGPEWDHYVFYRPGDEYSVLFIGELVRRFDSHSPLELSPVDPDLDPEIARRSLDKLLELDFDLLCMSHGGYIDSEPKLELAKLLDRKA
jgi:glyoxylase-like metal-dependent hydrolase (beta-lactamase superfamily II)